MRHKRTIPFKITDIDSLGQGVSKLTDKITFILKTLPGEEGIASILAEKKGVAFAELDQLEVISSRRVEPSCPHYKICPSCHYQHMNYQDEMSFKLQSLTRLMRKIVCPPIEVIEAPERFNYRNRIQLHYDTSNELLGMLDGRNSQIVPIPECIITKPEVKKALQNLYSNKQWLKAARSQKPQGHVEIYQKDNEVKISWNKPYAEGGFTQVYQEMNQKLLHLISDHWSGHKSLEVLDLFAGNGNISNHLDYSKRLCVDYYSQVNNPNEFSSINLYEKNALSRVKSEVSKNKISISHLILDPPRSGLKDFNLWVSSLKPEFIAYISCDPHTLSRDLSELKEYSIDKLVLLDFFPATYHFETLALISRKK